VDDLLSIVVSNAVAATVLAVAAIAVGAVYRRPALVHGLWLLVLLKLVTPPLVYIPVAWPMGAESEPEVAAGREEPTIELPGGPRFARPTLQLQEQTIPGADLPDSEEGVPDLEVLPTAEELSRPASVASPLWPQILRIVWAFGALAWFVLVVERLHHFRRLLRFARPAPAALQDRARRLARSLGLRYCPRVRLLPGRIAPMLWAIGGPPRLLVPADLLGVLSDEQLDTLLVHELAHLRRRDHWVRLLEFVVMGLYWWHPVVWYARRELREAEEQCCDAWVVSTLPDTGRTYASALLDTLDFLSTAQAAVPPLASGLGQIADLKRRLTMIMQGNTPRSLTWPGCLAVITLGLTLLPMLPSLHGEPPTTEEEREQIEDAKKDIEKAKADLEREMAELVKRINELARTEQRLVNESVRKTLVQVEKAKPHISGVVRNATVRIEITLPADEKVDPNEVIKEIQKALPENLRKKVAVRSLPATQQLHLQIAPPGVSFTTPPQPPRPAGPNIPTPTAIRGVTTAPLSKSSEKRINDLEKKLERVLEELHELRKQMRQPHGGGASAPEPIPGAAGVPAPAPLPPAPPGVAPVAPAPGVAPVAPVPTTPPAVPTPPAATPLPIPGTPPLPPGPSARRLPNPYGEYRFAC
jgi:beta-lactamase regulating signal transducer with metallopeptidase domain